MAFLKSPIPFAAGLAILALAAQAQQDATLKPVTVNEAGAARQADITGLGDVPLSRAPVSATVIDARQIEASGARRLADVMKFDASITDAYNATGYWDYATVRGFVIDNRTNYRREGLPISAETTIPLENKERIELLKGTSGIQSGTSAPGGLINYAVKRPTENNLRSARVETTRYGGLLLSTDLGGRFGPEKAFGYRFNAAGEDINNYAPGARGNRQLLALAMDWRISKDSVLEAEFEYSRRAQPSVPGLSLTGNTLPAPNPRLNISVQPWALPVVLQGLTGTVKFEQALNSEWRWSVQGGTQRLKSDDRSAFPFGCTGSTGAYYADRYCPNGDFDLYDFRSENERRNTSAVQAQLKGRVETAGIRHDLALGLMTSTTDYRFGLQAYNYVGTGNLANLQAFAPAPALTGQNTNRTERTTELSASDAIAWNKSLSTWVGLRLSQLRRDSILTDGTGATSYSQGLATPWLAATYQLTANHMLYASYGQGIESQVVPNRPAQYTNAGVALPALKSRQWEFGAKGSYTNASWTLAYFDIVRPVSNLDACTRLGIVPCLGQYDGSARHRGVEAGAQWLTGSWTLGSSASLLNARRSGSTAEPGVNGSRPANVPDWVLRAQAAYRVAGVPGLQLESLLSAEGQRAVLPDQTIMLPAWSKLDANIRYNTTLMGVRSTWTLGVENLTDKRYFKEAPYQFGHVYLFPGAPRTVRIAYNASL